MKKEFIYLCTLALAFMTVLSSCGDDFSETVQVGTLENETLGNPQGVNLLLTGAYSSLDGVRNNLDGSVFATSGDNWWLDVLSDDAHVGSEADDQADIEDLERNIYASSNSFVTGRFSAIYGGINRTNGVLDVIRNIDLDALPAIEAETIRQQEGEARFLRAHFNFEATKIYGNVPFISVENFSNLEFNQPNSGPLWEQIEEDFQFAVDNLPDTQSDAGRPTAGAARAYLGKALVYQEKWTEALGLLMTVVNSGEFSLASEYLDNFTAAGENGPESVFAIQFAADDGLALNGNQGGTLNFPNGGPFGSCCGFYQPTLDLANAFIVDGITGLPNNLDGASELLSDWGLLAEDAFTPDTTTPVDPRLDYTVGRRGIDFNGFGVHPGSTWVRASFARGDISGPLLAKKNVYQESEIDVNQGTGQWGQQHSGVNYNIMRYADVLLLAAEAAAETGDLGLALDLTNQVRARAASMTPVQAVDGSGPAANYRVEEYPSFPSQQFAIEAVRMERRLELGMEGHRLFDLRRWGVTQEVLTRYYANEARTITSFGSGILAVMPYSPVFDILPIPINAIDLSGGVLTQNPGY